MINRINKDDIVETISDIEISDDWVESDLIDINKYNISKEQLESMLNASVDTVSKEILYCKINYKLSDFISYILVYNDKTATTIISPYNLEVAFMQEYFRKYGIKVYE